MSRPILETAVEKEGRSVPSVVWRLPVGWFPFKSVYAS